MVFSEEVEEANTFGCLRFQTWGVQIVSSGVWVEFFVSVNDSVIGRQNTLQNSHPCYRHDDIISCYR